LVHTDDFPESPAVMVTCDCASFDRLGHLGHAANAATELIWIDHHRSNDGRGTIRLVDPASSSTCEIVAALIDAIGGPMTDASAVCLSAGLFTDTGRFQYEATSPTTLRLAARLREHPFDHARLSQALYEDNRAAYLDVASIAMARARLEPEADLVWTYVLWSDLERAGVGPADIDDLIDVVRTAREADVAALVKQQRDGRFKVSVRSRGAHDLSAIAATFGGGGHRLAAGYTSERGPAETIAALREALARAASA
jgi:phosphoesterase RecJ-like protein